MINIEVSRSEIMVQGGCLHDAGTSFLPAQDPPGSRLRFYLIRKVQVQNIIRVRWLSASFHSWFSRIPGLVNFAWIGKSKRLSVFSSAGNLGFWTTEVVSKIWLL